MLALLLATGRGALAWEPVPGQFQGWARGGPLTVYVDPIPSDAPPYMDQAVADAIRTYNDAMLPFCGLQLARSSEAPVAPGILVRWTPTPPAGRWTDVSDVENQPGLRQIVVTYRMSLRWRGIRRLLTHAMGHALGLGHSRLSDGILLWRTASLTGLNSTDPLAGPGADELAGLKTLWGNCALDATVSLDSSVTWLAGARSDPASPVGRTVSGRPSLYRFTYAFSHDNSQGSPQTELSLALPSPPAGEAIEVRPRREGWTWMQLPGDTAAVPQDHREIDGYAPAGAVLQFRPPAGSGGLPRNGTPITITIDSPLGPLGSRAFSNSSTNDSIDVPVSVPGDRGHPAPSPTAGASPSGTHPPQTPTAPAPPAVPEYDDALWIETADGRIVRIDDMSLAPWETVVLTRTQTLYGDIGFAPDATLYGVGLQTDRLMEIDLAPGRSQVAVVRYDREAEVAQGLTNSRPSIEAAVRRLQVRSGTFIDKGLRLALEDLDGPRHVERNQRVMLLLTDGVHTGSPGEDRTAAAEVRSAGVRLYTIGLGGDVDGAALEEMAGDGRRTFFAPESEDLARIYGEVARDLMCPGKRLWGRR